MNIRQLPKVCTLSMLALGFVAVSLGTLWAGGSSDRPRPAVCFAPGTPPEIVAEVSRHVYEQQLDKYVFSDGDRWSGGQGNPRALTWSLMPDTVYINVDLGGGCSVNGTSRLFSRMDTLFASQGGRETWIGRIQEVFDRWEALTGVTYTRITVSGQDWDDGASFGSSGGATRGDIRIGMVPVLGTGCSGILAFNYYPGSGIGGDMVINNDYNWANSANSHRFLRNVVAHEHGHGLGIDHVCPSNNSKLLEPYLSTAFDGPQHDDIRAGQRGYGDIFEPDNTVATATPLGTLPGGAVVSVGTGAGPDDPYPFPSPTVTHGSILSIDANDEMDYFTFGIDTPGKVTITVSPVGRYYDSSTQNWSTGACNSGNYIDSRYAANLNVALIDGDGATVLATATAQPSGSQEVLDQIFLSTSGDYYVRVYEGDAPTTSQLYNLELLFDPGCQQASDCQDGAFCNGLELCAEGQCSPGEDPCPGLECDDVLDVCVDTACPAPATGVSGSRYLAVTPAGVDPVRLRVTPVCSVNDNRYVGSPTVVSNAAFLVSQRGDGAYLTPESWGETVYVTDEGVTPGTGYYVQADCGSGDVPSLSAAVLATAGLWGDAVGTFVGGAWTPPNGTVDFQDISAIVDAFKALPTAPYIPYSDLIATSGCRPDQILDFNDIAGAVDAFRAISYPASTDCPEACP